MSDAISSVSSSSVASSSSSTSKLSESTKKKLEALGLDPTKYTSEAAAQAAITSAQKAQQAQQTQAQGQPQDDSSSIDTIETNVKSLAANMGLSVGNDDEIDDIFDNISNKISELQSAAGTDETKKAELSSFQSQYSALSSEYAQAMATKNMTGASALASYNKASLGLS